MSKISGQYCWFQDNFRTTVKFQQFQEFQDNWEHCRFNYLFTSNSNPCFMWWVKLWTHWGGETHWGRDMKAPKPALDATSLLIAWNCSSSSSAGTLFWSPSRSSSAANVAFISFSLFSANRVCNNICNCCNNIRNCCRSTGGQNFRFPVDFVGHRHNSAATTMQPVIHCVRKKKPALF